MGKDKNSAIEKLKKGKGIKSLPKKEMKKLAGGRGKKRRWSKGCGGILPT